MSGINCTILVIITCFRVFWPSSWAKPWGGHSSDSWSDCQSCRPSLAEWFSIWCRTCRSAPRSFDLPQETSHPYWCLAEGNSYTCLSVASMYGLLQQINTWEFGGEIFPLLTFLLHQRFEFALLFRRPTLTSLCQESAITTVAHLFSSIGHMLRYVLPRNSLNANQLKKLLILLSGPNPLLLFVASCQKFFSRKFKLGRGGGRRSQSWFWGDLSAGVRLWLIETVGTRDAKVVEGGKGGGGDNKVVKVAHHLNDYSSESDIEVLAAKAANLCPIKILRVSSIGRARLQCLLTVPPLTLSKILSIVGLFEGSCPPNKNKSVEFRQTAGGTSWWQPRKVDIRAATMFDRV